MKTLLLLLIGSILMLSSCSTAYRSRQTPDDVYYSPIPQKNEYVTTYTQQDKNSYAYNNYYGPLGMNNYMDYSGIMGPGLPFGYSPMLLSYNPMVYNPEFLLYTSYPYLSMWSPYNDYLFGNYGYNYYGYPYFTGHGGGLYYNSPYYFPGSQGTGSRYTGPRRYNLFALSTLTPAGISGGSSGQLVNPGPAPVRRVDAATAAPQRQNRSVFRRFFSSFRTTTPVRNNQANSRTFYNNNLNPSNSNRTYSPPTNRTYTPPDTRTFSPPAQTNYGGGGGGNSSSGGSAPVRTFRR
ncbi:MAG: hypothetical protein KGM98_04030 [Bacteroidota bacterium]|nr:hypothetical protein [Bacteroidota bacterium]